MRIAILADCIDEQYAGIHHYARQLIQALLKFDHENSYVFIHARTNDFFKNTDHHIVPTSKVPVYASIRNFVLIPRLLKKLKVDAVWDPVYFGPFNLAKRIKRITTIHDLTAIIFPEYHTFTANMIHRLALNYVVKHADLLITPSNHTAKDLAKYYPHTSYNIVTAYHGRETGFEPTSSIGVLEKYSIKAPYFLCVGTIEPRKNIEILVQAFELFCKTNSTHQLVIIGKLGWKYEKIIQQIEASSCSNRIILAGYVPRDEMPTLYSQAQAFVYPSLYEGFGFPILEAMSCGAPCLISDNSSLPEVGGDAALYFPAKASSKLVELMVLIADNPARRAELSEKSLQQAKKFSWEHHVESIMKALLSLNSAS